SSNTMTATYTVTEPAYLTISANSSSFTVCAGQSITLSGSGASSYTWSGGATDNSPYIPIATTEYTVNGTTACGIRSAVITVTVNPLPTVTAQASNTFICYGSSITISGSGAQGYSWDNGVTDGVTLIPTVTTTYNVTGTD